MCNNCEHHDEEPYTDSDGLTWYYRTTNFSQTVERSLDKETWKELTDDDLAEMSENHMLYVESLLIPF